MLTWARYKTWSIWLTHLRWLSVSAKWRMLKGIFWRPAIGRPATISWQNVDKRTFTNPLLVSTSIIYVVTRHMVETRNIKKIRKNISMLKFRAYQKTLRIPWTVDVQNYYERILEGRRAIPCAMDEHSEDDIRVYIIQPLLSSSK